MGVPFDLETLATTGPQETVLPTLTVYSSGASQYDVSKSGTLVYDASLVTAEGEMRLVEVAMDGKRLPGEFERGAAALVLEPPRKQRHERRRERALGDEAAEQVGDTEGDDEDVGNRPGPEKGRDQDIANEAEDAAEQGIAADRRGGAEERHGRQV